MKLLNAGFLLATTIGLFFSVSAQNEFYNNGASVYITSGAILCVDGDVVNQTGTLSNEGELEVKGNLTNNATYTSTGTERFTGSGGQSISGNFTGSNDMYNVIISAQSAGDLVDISTDVEIDESGSLQFTNGILSTGANKLIIKNPSTSSVSGYAALNSGTDDKYVRGNLGRVMYDLGGYVFPVGDATELMNALQLDVLDTTGGPALGVASFISGGVGTINIDSVDKFCWPSSNDAQHMNYSNMTGEGYWSMEGQGGYNPNLEYEVITYPSSLNVNTFPIFTNEYRVLKNAGPTPTDWSSSAFTGSPCIIGSYSAAKGGPYTGFSIYATTGGGIGLPIELVSLTAEPVNNSFIKVSWVTETETENQGFEVQRSEDGNTFETIGWVDGNGTTTEIQEYYYDDKDVAANKMYYYRLKQIDFNGDFENTYIVSASINADLAYILGDFYPVPASEFTQMDIQTDLSIDLIYSVYDLMGRKLSEGVLRADKGSSRLELDVRKWASADYMIQLNINGEMVSKRIRVIR